MLIVGFELKRQTKTTGEVRLGLFVDCGTLWCVWPSMRQLDKNGNKGQGLLLPGLLRPGSAITFVYVR